MKKIGVIAGADNNFPNDVIKFINSSNKRVKAEMIALDALKLDEESNYSVIYDRVAYKVPFYKSFLKQSSVNGVLVVNNPFICHDDNSFIYSLIAKNAGILTPRAVLLPSKEKPRNTSPETFQNLNYPLDWDSVFEYIGFPSYLKSNNNFNYVHAFKIYNSSEFFAAYDLTGRNTMNLIESIDYDTYYKVFIIGNDALIFKYDPAKPIHLRYGNEVTDADDIYFSKIKSISFKLSGLLGISFNSLEFGIKNEQIYLTSSYEPASAIEKEYFEPDIYKNIVSLTANYLLGIALDEMSDKKVKNIDEK
jgi:hypothetical protein